MRASLQVALLLVAVALCAQQPAPSGLVTTGHLTVNKSPVSYTIRRLPVSAFPDLPRSVAEELSRRSCLIPQTYEAHQPENVIHGSFERAGSTDWAVLCSAHGTVSLLVFFSGAPGSPVTLASASETSRLSLRPGWNELGFDWGIDTASPERVREAQSGLLPRPPLLDHDAIADSAIEQRTVYRYFAKGSWTLLSMP
jgi:hypothetical protein